MKTRQTFLQYMNFQQNFRKIIIKAPNFGPHGNFGSLFQKGLLSLKRVLQENEHNKSSRKTVDLQVFIFCT